MATKNGPDWSRIPESLAFIIQPAKRFGHIQFEEQIDQFQKTATKAEKAELKQLADRLWEERDCEDGHALTAWVTTQSLTKHAEAARVHFRMELLNELGYC